MLLTPCSCRNDESSAPVLAGRRDAKHGVLRLEEVDPSARAPILRRYLQLALFIVDLLVIYGLVAHGGRPRATA